MNNLTHSQVTDLDFALLGHEDVFNFDISVNDTHLVQIFESSTQSSKDTP